MWACITHKDMVGDGQTFYEPTAFAYARVFLMTKKSGAQSQQQLLLTTAFGEPPLVVDWHQAILSDLTFEQLQSARTNLLCSNNCLPKRSTRHHGKLGKSGERSHPSAASVKSVVCR